MKKRISYLFMLVMFCGCGSAKKAHNQHIQLTYIDDYIIPEDLEIEGTKVGGLSGIEFHDGRYYLVCDHPGEPRFYVATIDFDKESIDTLIISDVVKLNTSAPFFQEKTLDLESIRYDAQKNEILLASEGSIARGKDPAFFRVTPQGEYITDYTLPEYFTASGNQRPRNNGVFEGLAESFDQNGYWLAMELPLEKDGSKPKLFPTKSPVRITHFDKESKKATKQFVMQLEGITKIPWLYFAVNGLTELLEFAPDQFLVLERAFSAGHGTNGNTVRIFHVDAHKATNTLALDSLRKGKYSAATKELVLDLKLIRKQLKEHIIDNIEGMTFGPDLPNGNKTLLLISDNNFNAIGKQLSQVILLELEM